MQLNDEVDKQITQCITLLRNVLGDNVLGVYLYGSAIVGGLQKFSDIDLFVVIDRATTTDEKTKLLEGLLAISGIYLKTAKKPIEMTVVIKSEINPWHYPPTFDFQYGDWLRNKFESGILEPWPSKISPDLALVITQLMLANKILQGPAINELLTNVPYQDFITATSEALDSLMADLSNDTRNVLLTLARIWCTVTTDTIRAKQSAAEWAISQLPVELQPVMSRGLAICIGKQDERWNDISSSIKPCADFIVDKIREKIALIKLSDNTNKQVKMHC